MKKKYTQKHLVILGFGAIVLACQMNSGSKEVDKPVANDNASYLSSNCTAPAAWFKKVDGQRQTPAPLEGKHSPFANNDSVTNCDFHRWSWQKFLWLTNNVKGKPLFLGPGFQQVEPHGEKIDSTRGIKLTDVVQASGSTGVLVTNKNYNNSGGKDSVYYSIHMNDLMFGKMNDFGKMALKNPLSVQDSTFPVGSLEIKVSWVNAKTIPDAEIDSYYVTDGFIRGVFTKIALIGMHVVGVVENHPEFIWATFEHFDLAPMYNWKNATDTTDAPVTSTNEKLLFDESVTADVNNINQMKNTTHQNVFSVYKYGVPVKIVSVDGVNKKEYVKTSQPEPSNYNHIAEINKSVKKQLTDVWGNYFYNGSIWIDTEGYKSTVDQAKLLNKLAANIGHIEKDTLLRGSLAAYNLTMETYVQVGFNPISIHSTQVDNLVNCFFCHSATSGKNVSPLYISHVFDGNLERLKGKTKAQIKQRHLDQVKQQIIEWSKNN